MARSRFGDRPEDEIVIEEKRILIAAQAGNLRMVCGGVSREETSFDPTNALVAIPRLCARNRSAAALFVDVRAIPGIPIGTVIFSPSSNGSINSNPFFDLSATVFQQVLLKSEELWLVSISVPLTRFMITEVQV